MKMERHYFRSESKKALVVLVLCLLGAGHAAESARSIVGPTFGPAAGTKNRRKLSYLPTQPQVYLNYYYGPLLSGPEPILVYLIWYGEFSNSQRAIVQDFFTSFNSSPSAYSHVNYPTVQGWWSMTADYIDANGVPVTPLVSLAGELDNPYSLGKSISEEDVQQLILSCVRKKIFPAKYSAAYFVLTSADVQVDTFCIDVCGSHFSTYPSKVTAGQQLPYAWVGNPGSLCPGTCAWPYAQALYGPPMVLTSPNGDVGMDGLVLNLAVLLAGMATNPYGTGYYEGDPLSPTESASACAGIYGPHSFPGNPGLTFINPATNGSFNAVGITGREFLLPALWLPSNQSCSPPPYY